MNPIGHISNIPDNKFRTKDVDSEWIVLDKDIFLNIFKKDIKRIYIYKKSERIAKAIQLLSPALKDIAPLLERASLSSLKLLEYSLFPPKSVQDQLTRELLTLSSILSIARSGNLISSMNAEVFLREIHQLLQDIASYEEPRIHVEDMPSVSTLMKIVPKDKKGTLNSSVRDEKKKDEEYVLNNVNSKKNPKGHIKDKSKRQELIMSFIRERGPLHIKDISLVLRDMGEKTIQREIQTLVQKGAVKREGNRRWTRYSAVV